ncbi:MAG: cysteine--tRNA ligase [Gemmatimonadota bacterium]
MTLHLFNTMTRRIEPFTPIHPGKVSLYTCGPTVWNYAHIGNFRTFLFEDLLRRWLKASGFQVYHVMNLTDVDDRIIAEAGKAGKSISEFVEPYVQAFFEDVDWLRIDRAEAYPRATAFVAPMIELVGRLLASGVAYKGEDGSVYFSIARFPAYGRLSRLDTRELKAGASDRVSADDYSKEDARDWVLWKAAKSEDEKVGAAWDAPFGRGRPGWHLECSAMALDLIGKAGYGSVLDIHAGGVDLIFPHHEDEIAQSCAFTGQPDFARVWMHSEFLNVRGTKMSKRFGNITTPRDLRQDGVDPAAIRYLFYQTNYGQKFDLTDESLAAAAQGIRRLREFYERLTGHAREVPARDGPMADAAAEFRRNFSSELDNNLNSAGATAGLFDLIKIGNREMDQRGGGAIVALEALMWADAVLGILPAAGQGRVVITGPSMSGSGTVTPSDLSPDDPGAQQEWAATWGGLRRDAKKAKNYKEADRIRDLLKAAGWEVRDKPDGSIEVISLKG